MKTRKLSKLYDFVHFSNDKSTKRDKRWIYFPKNAFDLYGYSEQMKIIKYECIVWKLLKSLNPIVNGFILEMSTDNPNVG